MGTINNSDIIFATIIRNGRQIASLQLSGISSLADIIRHIRAKISSTPGILTLQLRNGSQGWTHCRPCMIF